MSSDRKTTTAAEADPTGAFERAYAEAAGVAHETGRVTQEAPMHNDTISDEMVDDLAAILWRTEAFDVGAPVSIAEKRTREAFSDESDGTKNRWRKFARAALASRAEPVGWQNIETPSSILTPEQYAMRMPHLARYYRPLYAAPVPASPAEPVRVKGLPATQPYVDRIIRIFRDKPHDDTSAVVLRDYAQAALDLSASHTEEAADGWRDGKGRTLADLLAKWRKRDEELDRGTWLGVSEIAGRVCRPKDDVRRELHALAANGEAERIDCVNGVYWRGASPSSGRAEG